MIQIATHLQKISSNCFILLSQKGKTPKLNFTTTYSSTALYHTPLQEFHRLNCYSTGDSKQNYLESLSKEITQKKQKYKKHHRSEKTPRPTNKSKGKGHRIGGQHTCSTKQDHKSHHKSFDPHSFRVTKVSGNQI